jgi:hypothetical protein
MYAPTAAAMVMTKTVVVTTAARFRRTNLRNR